jgi:WD40 repeat protein
VQLWRVVDGTQVWREQDDDYVWSLAFAPDGQTLASGSGRTVQLWATADGQLRWTLEGHGCHVFCVAFSPDGKRLASGGDWSEHLDYSGCTTVILWDPRHGRELHELQGQTSDVRSVAFNPCGQRLLSGGAGTVRVWDTANGQHLLTFSLAGSYVPFFRFGADGSLNLPGRWQPVFCFEADGSVTVATHNYQTTVAVWRLGLPL